jgi:hypothetical protein
MPDIEELIRIIDPARRTDLPSPGSAEALQIYRRATAAHPGPRVWQPKGRWAIGGLGLAAASVAAAVTLVALSSLGSRPTMAVLALDRVADVAAQQEPASALPPGDYLYNGAVGFELVSQIGSGGDRQTYSVLAPFTREVWAASDGSGHLRQQYTGATFLSPADRAAWVAMGSPEVNGLPSVLKDIDSTEGPGQLAPSPGDLPTDPGALLADIEAGKVDGGGAPLGPAGAFQIIGDLLERADASPVLRSALYQAAAQIPGVQLIGAAQDAIGRAGTAVGFTSQGERDELIFDSKSSQLLGEETVVSDPAAYCRLGLPGGTVISSTAYVGNGVVASTDQTPSGLTGLGAYHVHIPVPATVAPTCVPSPATTPPPASTTTTTAVSPTS